MKISHGTRIEEIEDSNGYGYATVNMLNSLQRLGYNVEPNDASADVEIWFDQPHHWKWSKGVYRIGYHPWESTQLLPPGKRTNQIDWAEAMNQCDEVWTPSPLIAEWYQKYMGIKPPVYVYEHGVDPMWAPKTRSVDGTFKFLHVGAQAARKGGLETMRALRLAFPRSTDVVLNLKIISQGWKVGVLNRVHVHNGPVPLEELIQMHYDNHVYVYPSYGEGFGLTPLQAMATGMPTITVPGWAPYAQFLDPDLSISSKMVKTPWPTLHPGMVLQPSQDDVVEAMRFAYNNYEAVEARAQERVSEIMDYYSWDRLTKEAFENLAGRL